MSKTTAKQTSMAAVYSKLAKKDLVQLLIARDELINNLSLNSTGQTIIVQQQQPYGLPYNPLPTLGTVCSGKSSPSQDMLGITWQSIPPSYAAGLQ